MNKAVKISLIIAVPVLTIAAIISILVYANTNNANKNYYE